MTATHTNINIHSCFSLDLNQWTHWLSSPKPLRACGHYIQIKLFFHSTFNNLTCIDSLSSLQNRSGYMLNHLTVVVILIQVPTFRRQGSLLYFVGYLSTSAGLPSSGAANVAAKASTLHGPLAPDWALSSDIYASLHCAVLSSWQDDGPVLLATNSIWWNHLCRCGTPLVPSGRRKTYLCACGSHTQARSPSRTLARTHMAIYCMVNWHLSVLIIVYHWLYHISVRNVQLIVKTALYSIWIALYLTCMAMITAASLIFQRF
jgi:hypothetical protein